MTIAHRAARAGLALAAASALIASSVAQATLSTADASTISSRRCNAMRTKVYESTNPHSTATLLTTWKNESANARAHYGFTQAKGTPFRVSRSARAGLVPVHRLFNPRSTDFLWTKSTTELRSATSKYGYVDNGVDFYASVSGGGCLKPVYRYVKNGIRRYAVSPAQRRSLVHHGWSYESIAFFAPTTARAVKAPVVKKPAKKPAAKKPAKKPAVKKPVKKPAVQKATGNKPGPLRQPAYVSRSTSAWNAYAREKNPATKALLYQIAASPTSTWLGGSSADRRRVEQIMRQAAAAHRTAQFVLYAIPNRDCGGYSAGGVHSVSQYKQWVDSVRKGIAGRKAMVIVEPDAIGMGCLSASQQADRYEMLRYAMTSLSSANTYTYLHAGSGGIDPHAVAAILKRAGIAKARGFALNVSSFGATSKEIAYGKSIVKALGMNKHFVIDTSRNGLGRASSNGGAPGWCNPPGRALGHRPTTKTASPQVDAYMWIKPPGESDGQCHAGDPWGWFQSYAVGLAQRALANKTIARL